MKQLLFIICILVPSVVYGSDCKVVEYPDRSEVECIGVPSPPNPTAEQDEENERQNEIKQLFETCRKQIEYNLKSPLTAIYNFADKEKPIYYSYGDKHMDMIVDSQNGYGAMVRGYYTCHFDTYLRLKDLRITPRH